jgi:hypothetical protein
MENRARFYDQSISTSIDKYIDLDQSLSGSPHHRLINVDRDPLRSRAGARPYGNQQPPRAALQ